MEWHARHSGVDPRCGSSPCVNGLTYCFWTEFQVWHSWEHAELGVDSVLVSIPGAWHVQQVSSG